MPNVLILNGPNLNMLGKREPNLYGIHTLESINRMLSEQAQALNLQLEYYQSNAEHELIHKIQTSFQQIDCIIFNPGALTHTSIALRDALLAVDIPFIEVHLTNIYAREHFRHHSFLADIAIGVITGFGAQSYFLALEAAYHYLSHAQEQK